MTNFADTDIKQITEHGLTVDEIEQQIKHFKSGFPFADIVRPATSGDGICEYNSEC